MQPIYVILAGGRGERFWPLSRSNYPKQLLKLFDEQSLLQATVARIRDLAECSRIMVVTNVAYEAEVRKQLPFLPDENIIVELESRNTAPAVGLAAFTIKQRFPKENPVVAFMPSDLWVKKPEVWQEFLKAGCSYCSQTNLPVIPGTIPTRPETGYGYIQRGELLGESAGLSYYTVKRFTEKPDLETAKSYLTSGDYLWNGGISIWRNDYLLQAIADYLPELYKGLTQLTFALDQDNTSANRIYSNLPAISVDYGLLERVKRLTVFIADFEWDDLGNWLALERTFNPDNHGNVIMARHLGLDTSDSIIVNQEKPVVTLGIDGLIIVETPDVLMVIAKDRVADIRRLIKTIKESDFKELL
ncbi:MAG TPA: sugar phosphate nucleotidyltransferase [Bacillota bacterium]|jgi:mannose-1-phosphate guanylyltransferase|nr:sugar phosphate nucleotidyltransferase [Bacillota bacterium]HOL08759.1 sugar phosphate nucleotidyltransferase [Bacillota bacterium]HPO96338.1 sugar phosphate nucleotidyltransferase [Bacillota bacterium]